MIEKMNKTAVDQTLPIPAETNLKICAGPKPQMSAATTGTTTKIGTGLVLP